MCKLLCLLSLCCLSLSAFASFEEYFQRIEQAEQSVNELNQPSGEGIASSMPDYMPGIEITAEEHAPGWMRPVLNVVRPEWEERRNRWEELGAAALYGDFLKAGKQDELDAHVREVMDKNKVFRDFMEEGDKPLSRMYMGREVMKALYGSRFHDVPEMYFHSRGEQMPEAGRQSLNDGYAAIWDDFSHRVRLADAPKRERARQMESIRNEQIRIQKEQEKEIQREEEQTAAFRQLVMTIIGSTLGALAVLFLLFRMVRSMRQGWSFPRWACFLTILLLGVAVTGGDYEFLWKNYSLPYGYYTLLRLTVAGLSAWLACQAVICKSHPLLILIAVLLTILYQPLVKITFEKETWCWINLATMPVLVILTATIDRREDELENIHS